jgi:hypothetical protein
MNDTDQTMLCNYAEWCILFIIMLNVIVLTVVIPNVSMLSVVEPF